MIYVDYSVVQTNPYYILQLHPALCLSAICTHHYLVE